MELSERIAALLEMPRDIFSGMVTWPFRASLSATPENISLLPSVASDLAHINSPPKSMDPTEQEHAAESVAEAIDVFHRDGVDDNPDSRDRPRGADAFPGISGGDIFSPIPIEHLGELWAAPGIPMGAAKPSVMAHENALRREPEEGVSVQVVCNSSSMETETEELYSFQDFATFDVDVRHNLTRKELRQTVQADHDLLHVIGHIEKGGIVCSDGKLDLATINQTGIEAFVLNGCESYQQGMSLVEAGALGGIVTTERVQNRLATKAGRTIGELLDNGFALYAAVDIVRSNIGLGKQYVVIGEASTTLSPGGGMPTLMEITKVVDGTAHVRPKLYPTERMGFGTMSLPEVGDGKMHLASGHTETYTVGVTELADLLSGSPNPVVIGEELVWSRRVDLEELLQAADNTT